MATAYIFIYTGSALGPSPDPENDFYQAASFDGRTVTLLGEDEDDYASSYFRSPKWVFEAYKQNAQRGQSGDAAALQAALTGSYDNFALMQGTEGAARFDQARKKLGGTTRRFALDDINMDIQMDLADWYLEDLDDAKKFRRQRMTD